MSLEQCKAARAAGLEGKIMNIVSTILLGTMLLLAILIFVTPLPVALSIIEFIVYFGWLLVTAGIVLGIFGHVLMRKERNACWVA